MTREEARALWEQTKANGAKLDGCSGHDFVDITPEKVLRKRYRCSNCTGEADSQAVHWYKLGLAHGRAAS